MLWSKHEAHQKLNYTNNTEDITPITTSIGYWQDDTTFIMSEVERQRK